jgi:NAD-dependent dihydropyrimidine dehydrogenase PreA subunit
MSSLTLYFNYLEYIISINLSQQVQVKNSKEYTPMSEDEIYLSFVGWLNKHWWKMPETDHLLPSFKTFFTKEEAQLLTGFPFMPTELGELAQLKKMDSGVLTEQLAALAQKGVVWKTKRGENLWFHLNDAFFIFFRGSFYSPSPGEKTIALAQPLNKYLHEGVMAQLAPAHNKPLRTVPVQRTVEDPRKILPHEDVLLLVDSQDFFALSHCACRQRKKLDPDSVSCNHPLETCIHLGKLAHYMVENELSRQVSKEEVLELLEKTADAGLVHAVSNWEKDADTICNCCRCSCLFFESFYVYGQDKSHDHSNYRVKINGQTCKGCGLCVQRCPMEALQLKESSPKEGQKKITELIAPDRCLGCGLCVHKCPTQSLTLEQRTEITNPPQTMGEWAKRWAADHKKAQTN